MRDNQSIHVHTLVPENGANETCDQAVASSHLVFLLDSTSEVSILSPLPFPVKTSCSLGNMHAKCFKNVSMWSELQVSLKVPSL